jgi:opacity protein-like surface antigen
MLKKLFIPLNVILISLMISTSSLAQVNVGLALKASTLGLGGDAVVRFHPKMDVRVGFETMGFGRDFEFKEGDINYDATANLKTGTISAMFDYYVGKSFFLAAGVGYNLFNVNIAGQAASDMPYGDISIPKDDIGNFDVDVDPGSKLSPYIGLGFGKALGRTKNLAMAFELGALYQGGPDLTLNSTGRSEEHTSDLYPVLKLSISYKIF